MDLGVIRCNDAEVLMDLEDLAERRINNLHAFNKRRGSESLSLRQIIENKDFIFKKTAANSSLSAVSLFDPEGGSRGHSL